MKRYYSEVTEHFFRLAVRYKVADTPISNQWLQLTKAFFSTLTPEDRDFLFSVFNKSHFTTADGLNGLSGNRINNRNKLEDLERAFAEYSELI